ncbi:MAG: SWIM zinc finger family protein [Lachnospiraceae bacterium]|nr:SWIM zinc finger family protein [Lachnospiraceae bacterium]
MEELKKLLLQTDDEYLTGLCNKGTVKRAYKDLGEENPSVQWQEEGAEVRLKEVICQIRVPLGESSCSCPSRSICRHLITAILSLKQGLDGEEKAGLEEGTQSEQADNECDSLEQKQREGADGQKPESDRQSKMDKEEEAHSQSAAGKATESSSQSAANGEQKASNGLIHTRKKASDSHTSTEEMKTSSTPLLQEISSLSLTDLKRACKGKNYQSLVTYLRAGNLPDIQQGTVITVRLPWEETVVKLLSPLAYSSCSCHSKKLCTHKAQAILAVGLSQGIWDVEKLEQLLEEKMVWDNQMLQQTAASIKEVLRLQLMTGLSRLSPEAEESMERLAVISHSTQLPAFETGFRVAAAEYRMYFERKAAFRVETLLERLLKLYRRTVLLEEAREPEKLRNLAGSFRDTYYPMPRLHLVAIGARNIQSKTGYEGESYYFLEINQGRWYTWTDVRPVFYEGVRRRPAGKLGQSAAPWSLGCSRDQLMEMEFFLEQGKATEDGRLSVSQDTKGELVGVRNLKKEEISRMIFLGLPPSADGLLSEAEE